MAADRYVALLRGINVGGNNIIKMADLRESFSAMGFDDVQTYIQSGNVVFSARQGLTIDGAVAMIGAALGERFSYDSRVAVVSADELRAVVGDAPAEFGAQPERYRYDVVFVLPSATPAAVFGELPLKDGVDEAHSGRHAVYLRRLISRAAQSHLSRISRRPIYQTVTVRNWNTTRRLLAMLDREQRL